MRWNICIGLALLCSGRLALAATNQFEDPLYHTPKVLLLKLDIPGPGLETLRREPKTYVKGNIREGDKAYTNCGIRLKGASSVKMLDKKPSLSIKFDEFESGQYFYGHQKIVLNDCVSDPSYLSEPIGAELFRAAGVPAPKVTFARIEMNGRDLGLYVLAQAPNRDFLSDYFKKTKGNFYEGSQADVTEKLRHDSGNGPKDQADVKALAQAARLGDQGQRMKKLAEVLDMDEFLSFMAMEVLTWHHQGYILERDNYRIYHDPVADRMVFMPEELDALFSKINGPLFPECKGIVARSILETGEGQRLYREKMTKLLQTVFKPETIHARINDLTGKIRAAAARDGNEAKAFDSAVAQLRDTIAQRARFIEEELKKPR